MPLEVVNQSVSRTGQPSVGDSVDASGPIKDRTLAREDVPDEWEEPIFDADNFIIEGPASVEIIDRSGQQVQMDAVEDALHRYIESDREPGIISIEHEDVPVGVPVWEWQTDDGTLYETVVADDEFRLVANIGNETMQGKLARLKCLTGDYSGYSVTVFSRQEHRRPDGTRVTVSCDLHATTLGDEDLLMNPAADFEVVDFKAGSPLAAAIERRLRRRGSAAGHLERALAPDQKTTDSEEESSGELSAAVLDRLTE